MQPQIDIDLLASPYCFLDRGAEFNIWLKFRLHYRGPITLVTTGSIFDPAATLIKSRIEIIDAKTGERVKFPEVQILAVEEKSRSAEGPALILEPEGESYFFWSTNIPGDRWREHPFDISGLVPDREYTVRYRDHGITRWFVGSQPAQQETRSEVQTQSAPLTVNLLGEKAPSFTTRQKLPPPPPVSTTMTTSTPICSLSGSPPFTIYLDWKLHSDRAISALLTRENGHNIGLDIRDPERNGRRIGPPADGMYGDVDESPPDEEELLRFQKNGDIFPQSYTLAVEPKRNGLVNADTWNLRSGKTYALTLRKSKWRWRYEDELADGELQDPARVVEILRQEPRVEWKPECRLEFRAD